MKLRSVPEMLLIAGTGRNSGKTTLACNIIKEISLQQSVYAIKITPHFHDLFFNKGLVLLKNENVIAIEETELNSEKDSSLMLKAGAERVFFVMTKNDDVLITAVDCILNEVKKGIPIVCESGGLRNIVEPGLFVMMNKKDQIEQKTSIDMFRELADVCITFDGQQIDFDYKRIEYVKNIWKIKTTS